MVGGRGQRSLVEVVRSIEWSARMRRDRSAWTASSTPTRPDEAAMQAHSLTELVAMALILRRQYQRAHARRRQRTCDCRSAREASSLAW